MPKNTKYIWGKLPKYLKGRKKIKKKLKVSKPEKNMKINAENIESLKNDKMRKK